MSGNSDTDDLISPGKNLELDMNYISIHTLINAKNLTETLASTN